MKYEIKGDTLPVVICHLEAGERMITERGSMAWMSPNMKIVRIWISARIGNFPSVKKTGISTII